MQAWTVQDAKTKFSELLYTCLTEGPQMVIKRGAEVAILVPMHEWRRLQSAVRPSLKQLLLPSASRPELLIPPRGKALRRNIEIAQ